MLIPTVIMAGLALVLFVLAYTRGGGEHIQGVKSAWQMLVSILPLLVCAFLLAGLLQAMLPKDLLSRWVGNESGFRGILIGAIAGGLTPGGPYISLPVVAVLLKSGANVGTMVAYVTAWSLWAFARMPMEIGILGFKFTALRFVSSFLFPPLAGLLANFLVKLVKS